MTNTALQLFQTILNGAWLLFTGWHVPGTNLTPAAFFFFCLAAALSIRFIKHLMSGRSNNSGGDKDA